MNNHYRAEDSLAYKRRRYTAKLHPEVVQDLFERVNDGAIDVNLAMLIGDILGPGDWRTDAACRDADPEWFFPVRGNAHSADARALCEGCTVRQQCFEYANDAPEVHGIWGGHNTANRRRINRASGGRNRESEFDRPTLCCVDCFADIEQPTRTQTVCADCREKRKLTRNATAMQQRGRDTYWAASA